jgi:GT2 family glycosyltransferase
MDPMPRVSVIIPAFNAEPYITETLDSVLSQTYPHFEVIVSSLAFRHMLDSLRFSPAMRPEVVGRLALDVLGRRSSGTASR